MAKEKAPGSDDFIMAFYIKCWSVIKHDLVAALNSLFNLDGCAFQDLNVAHLILLLKHPGASEPSEFHPISLVHSFLKLFSKVFLRRFASELPNLVGNNQGAFLQNRSTHDNFELVNGPNKLLTLR